MAGICSQSNEELRQTLHFVSTQLSVTEAALAESESVTLEARESAAFALSRVEQLELDAAAERHHATELRCNFFSREFCVGIIIFDFDRMRVELLEPQLTASELRRADLQALLGKCETDLAVAQAEAEAAGLRGDRLAQQLADIGARADVEHLQVRFLN